MPHNHSWDDDVPKSPATGYLRFPVKIFEIRDRGTFMPMMAVRLMIRLPECRGIHTATDFSITPVNDSQEDWLLRRAGYGRDMILNHGDEADTFYVILVKLDGVKAEYDPFAWSNPRTLSTAHQHILANWDKLKSGDLIDVEFILGESAAPNESESVKDL